MYDSDIPCIWAVLTFTFKDTITHTQTDLPFQCMIIIFLASQLYSHLPSKSHTHTHSQTDRLTFSMYDSDIPCIWAVLTFLQRHNHTYTDRQTYLHNVWWSYSVHLSCILIHSNTHTHTLIHTHRQTDLSSQCMMIIFRAFQLYSQSLSKTKTPIDRQTYLFNVW